VFAASKRSRGQAVAEANEASAALPGGAKERAPGARVCRQRVACARCHDVARPYLQEASIVCR